MTLNEKRRSDGKPLIYTDKKRNEMEKFSDRLFDLCYTKLADLHCEGYVTKEPLSFEKRLDGNYIKLSVGDKWAENAFDCAWFHITGRLPKDCNNNDLVFVLNCGGEALIYDNNGIPVQSITCYSADFGAGLGTPIKQIIPVYDGLHRGEMVDFWLDCAANDLFGNMEKQSRIQALNIAKENKALRKLAYDVQALLGAYDCSASIEFKNEIGNSFDSLMNNPLFTEEWAENACKILSQLLEKKNSDENTFTYSAIGHAHLDLAWLWPIRESKRKAARTIATQIKNIEKYPDYIFGASQAQLYQWIKEGQPYLYKKVQDLAKTNNWDVQGATWVEMDSNLICGESMVRQFYYGKDFFKKEFNKDMKIFWVPDSFGYSGCLPQVMKLSDVPYFLTQKISWNVYNKFPYHTFFWKGIDGSTVLSHMLPEDTYNAPMRADLLTYGEKNYQEREISNISMSLFGIGDGGAGPGYEHIERAYRYKNLKGLPKVRFEKSLDFFNRLDDKKTQYPTFEGELYLERHQGTYTTRADNKRYNRKCEFLLHNYEILYCLAKEKNIETPISINQLEQIWKEILLYQFHDILPGSSINRVYDECHKRYKIIENKMKNAVKLLAEKLFEAEGFINFNSFSYEKPVEIDEKWYLCSIAPLGFSNINKMKPITNFSAQCSADKIENDCVCVTFKNGVISSVYNKYLDREFVPENAVAGQISQYADDGDCWDIENCRCDYISTKQDAVCIGFSVSAHGAMAQAVCKYKVDNCEIQQIFYILDGDATVYAKLDLNVNQQARMLRIAFPTNIKADEGSFNIQFGHIKRKTTENNPVEIAQFEVSAHKFVDLSEKDTGLSLINDCKYGYRVKHGVIDMDLIRSPKGGPGKDVDQGKHTINYAIFTHKGQLSQETYKKAYELNNPPIRINGIKSKTDSEVFYNTTNDSVILETIKYPANGNGIITRFYNSDENPQSACVSIKGYKPIEVVNIPEEKIADKTDGNLSLRGFELINLRWIKE